MQAFKSYFTPTTQDGETTQTQSPTPMTELKSSKSSWHPKKRQTQAKPSGSSQPNPSIELSPASENHDTASPSGSKTAASYHVTSAVGSLNASMHNTTTSSNTTGPSTPTGSRPASFRKSAIFPSVDASNSRYSLIDIKNDMMVKWLYEQQVRKQYASGHSAFEGVVLKKARGDFTCCPPQMKLIPDSLYNMVIQMNVRCAMTVNTPVVRAILGSLRRTDADIHFVPLSEGLRIQILRTTADLPRAKLHHFAAFVEDVGMLIVWEDDAEMLLRRIQSLESQLVEMIWGNGADDADDEHDEKGPNHQIAELHPSQLEDALTREHRPVQLTSAVMVGLTLALCFTCLSLGWRALVLQIMVDGDMTRLALLAVSPLQFFVSLVSNPTTHGSSDNR